MSIISVTEKASGHRVLVNTEHVLMVRPIAHGGCNVYLASASIHAPDILTLAEDIDDLARRMLGDRDLHGTAGSGIAETGIDPKSIPH
jgi:hypothetical protein